MLRGIPPGPLSIDNDCPLMHILLVAPCAPPKNSPEALQVGRFLAALPANVRVTLVTTPVVSGWEWGDPSLAVPGGVEQITIELPFHRLTQRILRNRHLRRFHVPDTDFWITKFARSVADRLSSEVDVIYSRSSPFSAAMLGRELKQVLGRPWLMHLSDPWAGSPYRAASSSPSDFALEDECVQAADLVSLTTEGQARLYSERYPILNGRFVVAPNMAPPASEFSGLKRTPRPRDCKMRILHLGSLYGARNPSAIFEALTRLQGEAPAGSLPFELDFVGNVSEDVARMIDGCACARRRSPVTYRESRHEMLDADLLLSIEPKAYTPLHKHFLMSKVVDYAASGRPMLALTSRGSVTDGLCKRGYGWSFEPDDVGGLEEFLRQLGEGRVDVSRAAPTSPAELDSALVTAGILGRLEGIRRGTGP